MSVIRSVPLFYLASCGNNLKPFLHEEVDNVDGFIQNTSTVSAQVNNQRFSAFFLQIQDRFLNPVRAAVGKAGIMQISHGIIKNGRIGDGVDFYFFANKGYLAGFVFSGTLNFQFQRCSGSSF
ncbi:hypothetical protein SDC9_205853 [bioreactor metagenome]|uniref:Uncharacterized protein n=1 Tax=bioreactor metagenome TaxID=1076179 RepID=A0A645J4U5_9ZZZZ